MKERDIWLRVGFVFLISYVALYVLSTMTDITGLYGWGGLNDIFRIDYTYWLFPICGFFMVFFLIDWIESYLSTKFTRTPWFPLFFLVMGLVAFYIAVLWLFCNLITLNLGESSFCSASGAKQTMEYLAAPVESRNIAISFLSNVLPGFLGDFFSMLFSNTFMKFFLESPYAVFLLSGVFGWAGKLVYFHFSQDGLQNQTSQAGVQKQKRKKN